MLSAASDRVASAIVGCVMHGAGGRIMEVIDFSQVIKEIDQYRHKYLMLGNGFSISLRPDIFTYRSLLDSAKFDSAPHVGDLFKTIGTQDFELVIKHLIDSALVVSIYQPSNTDLISQLKSDAEFVKESLVTAIAKRHPDRPYDIEPEQYKNCRSFLSRFSHIYTLNYDVLLYWALMHSDVDELRLAPDDGFRHPEREEIYVTWQQGQSATIHYLHGALHLFDSGVEVVKYTWSKTDIPIVDQVRMALSENKYPLFVAEGTTESKLDKIMHNAYLHKSLRSLEACSDNSHSCFVVFGHSLADNDEHVLKCIGRGKTKKIFVSVYGDPNNDQNRSIEINARRLIQYRDSINSRYPLDIVFYDAGSAKIWG